MHTDDTNIYSNEILVDVKALNIDSASFAQIEEEAGRDFGGYFSMVYK